MIKDLDIGRLSWIIQMGPMSSQEFLKGRRGRHKVRVRGGELTIKAEVRVVRGHELRNVGSL